MNLPEAITAATVADHAYEAAIKAAFGAKASRWTYPRGASPEVDAAFAAKVQADQVMHDAFAATWPSQRSA